jgi:hypothetical protein
MAFMSGFTGSLFRAARVYLLVALAAPVVVFAGVEAWRVLAWLVSVYSAFIPAYIATDHVAALYMAVACVYIVKESFVARERSVEVYVLLGLQLIGATAALYGLLAATRGLIPALQGFDLFDATFLSMSALLATYMVFHPRLNR